MKQKIPQSPFSTRLSGSAKETELRIRNIFQWKKKRPPVIALLTAALVVILCGSLVGFKTQTPKSAQWYFEGGEPEGGFAAPSPESTVMESYRAVLRGEMEFRNLPHYDNFDISRLQEAVTPDTSITLEPESFTAVDLDADGTPEVIVSLAISGVGTSDYLVLRWQDGVVYGYTFAEREFSNVKTDGTFWNTGGASDIGICRVTFDRDTRSIDRFTFSWERPAENGDGISYFVGHQEATEEEWERALSQWNAIPYVEWYEFTDDNIETILR